MTSSDTCCCSGKGRVQGDTLHCPVEATLDMIGGKYKTLILWKLISGPMRFSELRRAVPAATPKMLTQQLREMESDAVNRLLSLIPVFYVMTLVILFFLIYFASKFQLGTDCSYSFWRKMWAAALWLFSSDFPQECCCLK